MIPTDSNNSEHNLNNLYHRSNQELPPAALDQLILNQAKNSTQSTQSNRTWHPWLAAASVVFALPMIWLLTQNNELTRVQAPAPSVVAADSKAEERAISVELIEAVDAEASPLPMEQKAPSAMVKSINSSANNEGVSSTDARLRAESIAANRELLKSELKTKKRSLKPGNLDPMMALELQQFEQYLASHQLDKAEELLNEMQENYPDFNFDELIDSLAAAKSIE